MHVLHCKRWKLRFVFFAFNPNFGGWDRDRDCVFGGWDRDRVFGDRDRDRVFGFGGCDRVFGDRDRDCGFGDRDWVIFHDAIIGLIESSNS
jgi:hypothetical protein